MAIPYKFQRYLRTTRPARISLIAALAFAAVAANANEKRVTVPIALPFQNAAAHSAASNTASSVPALAPTAMAYDIRPKIPPVQAPAAEPARATSVAGQAFSSSAASLAAVVPSAQAASLTAHSVSAPAVAQQQPTAPSELDEDSPDDESTLNSHKMSTLATAPVNAKMYPAGHPEAFVAEFEDYIAKKVAPYVPGVAVVVVSQGQVKSLQAYGVRRAGTREKLTPDTVFRLASVSKTVASTAAGLLVKEGKITWDTKVMSELDHVAFKNPRYGKQITFGHLLSQSSGLPRHTYTHFVDENMSYADIVQRLRYVNFACPPGKCYAYQNVAYSLAGEMIKKRAGMSYPNYVEQKIFQPLGMHSASLGLDNYRAAPNRAAPHIPSGRRWIPTAVTANWYRVAPAAGVNASIVDMSQFLLAQMGSRQDVLPLSVLNQIQSRVVKNTPAQNYYSAHKAVDNTAYGLGWRVFDYGRNKHFVHHGGHVKGFRSEMVFNRDLQIGMVFLTNSETRLARDVIFKFLDMHAGTYSDAPPAAKKASKKANKKAVKKVVKKA